MPTPTGEAEDAIAVLNQGLKNPLVSESVLARITASIGILTADRQCLALSLPSSRRHAFTASHAVINHAEIVNANMGKLRAACYLSDRPNPGRSGL